MILLKTRYNFKQTWIRVDYFGIILIGSYFLICQKYNYFNFNFKKLKFYSLSYLYSKDIKVVRLYCCLWYIGKSLVANNCKSNYIFYYCIDIKKHTYFIMTIY